MSYHPSREIVPEGCHAPPSRDTSPPETPETASQPPAVPPSAPPRYQPPIPAVPPERSTPGTGGVPSCFHVAEPFRLVSLYEESAQNSMAYGPSHAPLHEQATSTASGGSQRIPVAPSMAVMTCP